MSYLRKDHKKELWDYLQNNPGWHTSNELAVVIGVSQRSIKRYAKDLIDTAAIFVSSEGYKANQKKVNSATKRNSDYESIKRVLINEFTQQKELNLYDLADQFYLSESTVLKLLREIQLYVKPFDLDLKQNGDSWSLLGSEMDKRKLISDILYRESKQTFIGNDTIQDSFPDINVTQISEAIKKLTMIENIYLNTFDFNNILLHIAIATHRIKNGYQSQNLEKDNDEKTVIGNNDGERTQERSFGNKLIDFVEQAENIHFSNSERQSLILIVQFSITRKHRDLEDNVKHSTIVLVDNLIKYVNSMLNIDLRVLNFREQFAIHIQRLLERSSRGYVERNPMTAKIRKSSPIIYECAVLISNRMEEIEDITLEDDEIAYIAMHIGNAVSEYINDLHKLYVVVLMPDYQSDNDEFMSRLERLFSQDIVIGRVIHNPDMINEVDYPRKVDFVIQVNSEYSLSGIRHANISQFLTQIDYKEVSQLIVALKHKQEKINFTNNLEKFFPKENFKIINNETDRENLFKAICNELEQKGIVTTDFKDRLEAREKMSSTAFGRVAIPHSLQMIALKTQGYVVIDPKGINWDKDNNHVNLMFLLAINESNKQAYRNIFDDLSQIAVDPKNIARLVKSKTYDEFIKQLTALL
ncbi:transcriptional antiterminator [Companilactobacillus kimchii DSM 13961 = JCM 10707]|uniref:Transcriptional antiterminator n=1 Tax=Companilactobacillus kimchii DSM 13961 = JCM 10707 TaxID=1423765 RepID=A0ABR5NVT3_9LACO|nr:transcriptional antiterminator [Companilactobacillus kimchii DSM 13961 = JCM 10707]